MDKAYVPAAAIEARGLRVRLAEHWHVAALRYFDPDGAFARGAAQMIGHSIPAPLSISAAGAFDRAPSLLAWKSPTESLLLCADAELLGRLAALPGEGCCVDLSGGRRLLHIEGTRGADLLARLGGSALDPAAGGATSGRLAEVAGMTLRLADEQRLIVVDRLYLKHLLRWIELTVCDLD